MNAPIDQKFPPSKGRVPRFSAIGVKANRIDSLEEESQARYPLPILTQVPLPMGSHRDPKESGT